MAVTYEIQASFGKVDILCEKKPMEFSFSNIFLNFDVEFVSMSSLSVDNNIMKNKNTMLKPLR